MRTDTIVWGFNGTLLPLAPYDGEQTLMLHKLDEAAPAIWQTVSWERLPAAIKYRKIE